MQPIQKLQITFALLLSFIASLGTAVYGYKFAEYYFHDTVKIKIIVGITLAIIGIISNVLLAMFSLLRMKREATKYPYSLIVILGGAFSAIPLGFISFFGYQSMIPWQINLMISFVIVLVNAAINYNALQLFIKEVDAPKKQKNLTARLIGLSIGVSVGIAFFLATTAGINELLIRYHLDFLYNYNLGVVIGVVSFLPLALLSAHTNTSIINYIYEIVLRYRKNKIRIKFLYIPLIIFCLLSGTMFSQIMREFLSPEKDIPALFKLSFIQHSVKDYLIFLAWLAGSGITFYCAKDLLSLRKGKKW